METKKTLVTGSAGFVGANLVRRLLRDGYEVFAAIRSGSNIWRLEDIKDQLRIIELNLLDESSIEFQLRDIKPHYIFHLAAHGAYSFQQSSKEIINTNFLGLVNLLSVVEKFGFERFIVTGSSSEYGAKSRPMQEDDLPEPNTLYGVTKVASTLYCQHRAREGKLPIVPVRVFSAYGDWEEKRRLFPTLILKVLRGEDLELASPQIARDFVYVEDIVDALIQCTTTASVNGEVINLCSGRQGTIGEVVGLVLKYTQSRSRPLWGKYEARGFDTALWVGNPTKVNTLLGWRAKTSLEEGIKKSIEWFKNHQHFYENG